MKNEREQYFDVARGIVIILVVLGHVTTDQSMRDVIFSFHMPFFIIASGFFFKEGKPLKTILSSWGKKLILPYFLTQGLIVLYWTIINKTDLYEAIKLFLIRSFLGLSYESKISLTTKLGYSGMELNTGVLWFIPFFCAVGIIFWGINKFSTRNHIKFLGVIIFTIIGIILGKNGYWLIFSFDVACVSTIFIYVGYIIRKKDIIHKFQEKWFYSIALLIIWVISIQNSNLELATRKYTESFIAFTGAVAGSLLLLILCQKSILSKSRILQWFGRNSMLVLCAHNLEWNLVKYDFVKNQHYMVLFLCKMFIILLIVLGVKILQRVGNWIILLFRDKEKNIS